jgi:hypothetical protein
VHRARNAIELRLGAGAPGHSLEPHDFAQSTWMRVLHTKTTDEALQRVGPSDMGRCQLNTNDSASWCTSATLT